MKKSKISESLTLKNGDEKAYKKDKFNHLPLYIMANTLQGVTTLGLTILTIVFGWRGYSFYNENTGSDFVNDVLYGMLDTLVAGWNHPAFGVCCLLPILYVLLVLWVSLGEESEEQVVHD